jgi:transcriptional regulator with XRE-family HTH domain
MEALSEFATLLRRHRERRGWSCNETARAVGVDPSYVSRLERAEREPPRRRVIEDLAQALQLTTADQDALLVSAGFTPASVALLGRWDPTLQAVATVLTDRAIPDADQARFRVVIEALVTEWLARRPAALTLVQAAAG